MSYHPHTTLQLAHERQADFLREADRRRLAEGFEPKPKARRMHFSLRGLLHLRRPASAAV